MVHVDAGGEADAVGASAPTVDDSRVVEALRRGDEAAFVMLVERYHGVMVGVASIYVGERSVAEEVVQEAWLGVLQGIDRFAGRSSLRTWMFRILTNCAKSRAQREGRSVPFSSLVDGYADEGETAVDPDSFRPPDSPSWPGHWSNPPKSWGDAPETKLLSKEAGEHIRGALALLPPQQRGVITLRDVEGWSSDEVRSLFGISEVNQRVLLHRARSRMRRELARYLADD